MWTCVRVECSETRSTADAIEEPNLGRDRTVLAGASGVAVLPPTPPSGRVTGTGVPTRLPTSCLSPASTQTRAASDQSVDDPPSEVWRGSRCAATLAGMTSGDDGTLHDSEPSLGGDTIDEAVENSEEGTQAEDTGHTPSGNEPSGDSRGERMKDVVEHDEN